MHGSINLTLSSSHPWSRYLAVSYKSAELFSRYRTLNRNTLNSFTWTKVNIELFYSYITKLVLLWHLGFWCLLLMTNNLVGNTPFVFLFISSLPYGNVTPFTMYNTSLKLLRRKTLPQLTKEKLIFEVYYTRNCRTNLTRNIDFRGEMVGRNLLDKTETHSI